MKKLQAMRNFNVFNLTYVVLNEAILVDRLNYLHVIETIEPITKTKSVIWAVTWAMGRSSEGLISNKN